MDADPHDHYVFSLTAGPDLARTHLEIAAGAGHVIALYDLGRAAERAGDTAAAVEFFRRSRAGGYRLAEPELARLQPTDTPGTHQDGAASRAESDDEDRLWEQVAELRDDGRLDEARDLLADAAADGNDRAKMALADLLPDGVDLKETLYRSRAEAGDRDAVWALAQLLGEAQRWDEVITLWQTLAPRSDFRAPFWIAEAHRAAGRPTEALVGYRQAMREPRTAYEGARAYGELLRAGVRDEDRAGGEELLRASGHAGSATLGWLHEQRGEYDEAEAHYRRHVQRGVHLEESLPGLVRLLELRGADTEASEMRARLAALTEPAPVDVVPERDWGGELLDAWHAEQRGDLARAETLYRGLALSDLDQTEAALGLARLLDLRGETAEARRWREQGEAGRP